VSVNQVAESDRDRSVQFRHVRQQLQTGTCDRVTGVEALGLSPGGDRRVPLALEGPDLPRKGMKASLSTIQSQGLFNLELGGGVIFRLQGGDGLAVVPEGAIVKLNQGRQIGTTAPTGWRGLLGWIGGSTDGTFHGLFGRPCAAQTIVEKVFKLCLKDF
jgi:hypothetical protein